MIYQVSGWVSDGRFHSTCISQYLRACPLIKWEGSSRRCPRSPPTRRNPVVVRYMLGAQHCARPGCNVAGGGGGKNHPEHCTGENNSAGGSQEQRLRQTHWTWTCGPTLIVWPLGKFVSDPQHLSFFIHKMGMLTYLPCDVVVRTKGSNVCKRHSNTVHFALKQTNIYFALTMC